MSTTAQEMTAAQDREVAYRRNAATWYGYGQADAGVGTLDDAHGFADAYAACAVRFYRQESGYLPSVLAAWAEYRRTGTVRN